MNLEREPNSSGLSADYWRWARERAEEGFSARSIARRLGTPHSTILRGAARWGWDVAWGRPDEKPAQDDARPPSAPVSDAREPETGERSSERPETLRSPSTTPAPIGPPGHEASARLWHCSRCRLAGFDPNRGARAWHSPELCDERLARLDAGLDDSPEPFDVMRADF